MLCHVIDYAHIIARRSLFVAEHSDQAPDLSDEVVDTGGDGVSPPQEGDPAHVQGERPHCTKLLVSLYVALKNGWLHNVEDVWSAADSKADAAESSKSSGSAAVVKRGVRPLAAVTTTQKGQVREHCHSSCQAHG